MIPPSARSVHLCTIKNAAFCEGGEVGSQGACILGNIGSNYFKCGSLILPCNPTSSCNVRAKRHIDFRVCLHGYGQPLWAAKPNPESSAEFLGRSVLLPYPPFP